MSTTIFLSWSGTFSLKVAESVKGHLETVFGDDVTSFLSESDIGIGERGIGVIFDTLSVCNAGIFFITSSNWREPWINFEAGSIAKQHNDSRVMVLLLESPPESFHKVPLMQFQYKKFDKQGIEYMVEAIAKICNKSEQIPTYKKRLELAWNEMQREFNEAKASFGSDTSQEPSGVSNNALNTQKPYDALLELIEDARALFKSSTANEGLINLKTAVTEQISENSRILRDLCLSVDGLKSDFLKIHYDDVKFMKAQWSNALITEKLRAFMKDIDIFAKSLDEVEDKSVYDFLHDLEAKISELLDAVR
jgi:hypothetical protein